MRIALEFAIGDKEEIIQAVRDDNDLMITLYNKGLTADFSLHIGLDDLDYLIDAVSELRNIESFGLMDNLDSDEFFFSDDNGGVHYVLPQIKDLFASIDHNDAKQIATKWYKKLSDEYDQEIPVNDDVITSIEQMITICKIANEPIKKDLVFIWSL